MAFSDPPVGHYIRDKVLPTNLSLTDAAAAVGVSRVSLSKLVNGRARLTPAMAQKLEDAFGADAGQLLARQQQEWLNGQDRVAERPAAYVPAFLQLRASVIAGWPDRDVIRARNRLPVLLRTLVHSTGRSLTLVDFPGNDDSERPGWDGRVDAESSTPWVPKGVSYWEFGVDGDPRRKAEHDYGQRLKSVPEARRRNGTFIFVTPRRWTRVADWVEEKRQRGDWKDVRAYDASGLEQWLETSIAGQVWLARELSLNLAGTDTLESAWEAWAHTCEPHLDSKVFGPALGDTEVRRSFDAWLASPPERAWLIQAESSGEAVAFATRLLVSTDRSSTRGAAHRSLVIHDAATASALASGGGTLIIVSGNRLVDDALTRFHDRVHCVLCRSRRPDGSKPDVSLGLLRAEAFRTALSAMKVPAERIDRLTRETGRSPTILRRRLARSGAANPAWAQNDGHAHALVSLALAGAWSSRCEADRQAVSALVGNDETTYTEVERLLASLAQVDSPPVWQVGGYAGVVSKVDVLFAVRSFIVADDLERFFGVARTVLAENDPAFALDADKRRFACAFGRLRAHSGVLRESIGETLALFIEHADDLEIRATLGIDVEVRVRALVTDLLIPLTEERLWSLRQDLPIYAEAAPDVFLSAVEGDLETESPATVALVATESDVLLGDCPRAGLLDALELCAWRDPGRVTPILARLSVVEIRDHWSNTPFASLRSLFRPLKPQTAATVEDRAQVLRQLMQRSPAVGVDLCFEIVNPKPEPAFTNRRPRYRTDAVGYGDRAIRADCRKARCDALERLLEQSPGDVSMLVRLARLIPHTPGEYRSKILDSVETWIAAVPSRDDRTALARTLRDLRPEIERTHQARVERLLDTLRMNDPVIEHEWLFTDRWMSSLFAQYHKRGMDHAAFSDELETLRCSAIEQVMDSRGLEGLSDLVETVGDPGLIGELLCNYDLIDEELDWLRGMIYGREIDVESGRLAAAAYLLQLAKRDPERRIGLAEKALQAAPDDMKLHVLDVLPFDSATWDLLAHRARSIEDQYWRTKCVDGWLLYPNDVGRAIDHLLTAQRPSAAFLFGSLYAEHADTRQLVRLLEDFTQPEDDAPRSASLAHDLKRVFETLARRSDISQDELARLEFAYLSILLDTSYRVPALKAAVSAHPPLFAEMLSFVYRRDDSAVDAHSDESGETPKQVARARAIDKFFREAIFLPGRGNDGSVDSKALLQWTRAARRVCRDAGRGKIGDTTIGQFLGRACESDQRGATHDAVSDSIPFVPDAVCEVIEDTASPSLCEGFGIGAYNAVGMRVGDDGGTERRLAARYEHEAERIKYAFPLTSRTLQELADRFASEAEREADAAKAWARLR